MTRRAVMMRIEVVKTLEEDEGCGEDGVGELSSVDGVISSRGGKQQESSILDSL